MPDPEIDRRCSSCGVAVRQRAMFCPQCGKPIPQPNMLADTVDLKMAEPTQTVSETADTIAIDKSSLETSIMEASTVEQVTPARQQTLSTQNRSSVNLDDGSRSRVDKLRKASSVVITQASYDPSLRFLLVTAGLFLFFVVLLVLSKVLG